MSKSQKGRGKNPPQKQPSKKRRFATMLPVLCDSDENPMFPDARGVYLIENHPFKMDTVLYIGDVAEMKAYFKKRYNITFDDVDVDFGAIDGVTIPCSRKDGSQFIMIFIPEFDWTATKYAVLAHEIVHSSVFILKMSGVHNAILEGDNDYDSDDECLAHLVDSQMEMLTSKLICKAIRNIGKKKKQS
jgi:hypothetical protein